jgi:drug/metabolite transporter (DMT)-like permease
MNQKTSPASAGLSRSALAHLAMFATVAFWGAMFVVVKQAIVHIRPQWFNAFRMVIGCACLSLVWGRHWRGMTRAALLTGGAAGLSMAAGFFFQTQGLLYTSATNSAFLTALVVVLVPLLASVPGLRAAGGQPPHWAAWFGALLAFGGVALMTTPQGFRSLALLHTMNRGDLLTLGCALGFALQVIALEHGAARASLQQVSLMQLGTCMAILCVTAVVSEPGAQGSPLLTAEILHPLSRPGTLLAVLTAGVLATAVGFTVQAWAQHEIPATNLAVILTLEPVFAWLTAALWMGERTSPRSASGALLVLGGIAFSELFPRWRRPAR